MWGTDWLSGCLASLKITHIVLAVLEGGCAREIGGGGHRACMIACLGACDQTTPGV